MMAVPLDHGRLMAGAPEGPLAHDGHHRGDEQQPDDGGVEQHGEGEPDAELFDLDDVAKREGEKHGDHDERSRGDDAGHAQEAVLRGLRREQGELQAARSDNEVKLAEQKLLLGNLRERIRRETEWQEREE